MSEKYFFSCEVLVNRHFGPGSMSEFLSVQSVYRPVSMATWLASFCQRISQAGN
jgi:hypothetical protein